MIDLGKYSAPLFERGRSALVESLWIFTQAIFVSSPCPGVAMRRFLLRVFGARIGPEAVIKPGVRVKFPWKLEVGANTWIGENVWIDNLAPVRIGSNCCISQAAYLCTGSHNWSEPTFDLIVGAIEIRDGAWIAAKAIVSPGVIVGEGAVLALGGVATENLDAWAIYQGNPASLVKYRVLSTTSESDRA